MNEQDDTQAAPAHAIPPQVIHDLVGLYTNGEWNLAEHKARDIVRQWPDNPFGWKGLGSILLTNQRFEEALVPFGRAARLFPSDADVHHTIGDIFVELGRFEDAETSYHRAICFGPDRAETHHALGTVQDALGRLQDAEISFRRALDLDPDYVQAHSSLGTVLNDLGRIDEAEAALRRAVDLDPDIAEAQNNLGLVLYDSLRLDEAEARFRHVLSIDPGLAVVRTNLAMALKSLGRLTEAEAEFRAVLDVAPDFVKALNGLGSVLMSLDRYPEATEAFRRVVEIAPDFEVGLNNLGSALNDLGRFDEAESLFRRALEVNPDFLPAHNNLLFCLNYVGRPAAQTRKQAEVFGNLVERDVASLDTAPLLAVKPARLRVGLVSGDFHSHPVAYFLENILANVDSERIELLAYPTWDHADNVTDRLRAFMSGWTPLSGLDDNAAAARIRADEVHVLIDLAGHTARNRLPVFARRPAPVQVAWLGYFATTGLSRMDYIMGDPQVTPDHEADNFTETVWRLPDTYLCFTAPDAAVEVGPLPALTHGAVTFGSFNKIAKMNDAVMASWARVMRAVPGSRLLLIAHFMLDAGVRQSLIDRFAANGVTADRLVLQGPTSRVGLLAAYNQVDIALDPFPFTGGATSAEALWMGVPVLTRKGDHLIAHQGETLLTNAGLPDWIARDDDDFVAKAVAATADLDALAALRAGLRAQVLASPLFDAPRFARQWEDALWQMWTRRAGLE